MIAGSTLVYEIALMRIFSFLIWHHFAFMVISVALLGFAVSGVALHLRPALGAPADVRAAEYAALFGLAAVVAVFLVTHLPFDPTRLAWERVQLLYLFCYYAALLVPFTLAGLAVLTLLRGYAAAVALLYASDLTGAGLGCFLVVGAMQPLGAEGLILFVAAAAVASATLLRWKSPNARRSMLPPLALTVVLGLLVPFAPHLLPIPPGPGKGLHGWLDPQFHRDARLAHSWWSPLARIDVVEDSGRVSWTSNPLIRLAQPAQVQIVIDGDAATPIVASNGDVGLLSFLDYTLSSAGLQLLRPERVLVIGSGGGVDVLTALRHGVRRIDAVEINPLVVDLVTGPYAAWSGHLFTKPEVTLHLGEGRSYVRSASDHYDLIQLSLIDTWAASASGAYALAEGYLYTVEAFGDYLEHLTDGGAVTVTRWLDNPPRDPMRLCTIAQQALRGIGVERPEQHVVVLGQQTMANVLVKRSAWTASELDRLQQLAVARKFAVLYAPGLVSSGRFAAFFAARDPAAFISSYPYDVSPSTDESPFFFQFGRWRDAHPWGPAWREGPIGLSGRLVLLASLLQALLLSLVLLVAPLLWSGRRGPRPSGTPVVRVVAYFFLIGLCFMLLEIALMQRFTLFLGNPTYAIALVLAMLLLAAGLGSACSARLAPPSGRPWAMFLAVVGLTLFYAVCLPAILRAGLGLGLGARLVLGAAIVFPLGFALGIPFPAGIATLVRCRGSDLIGGAWAANGCASVLGPILAVLLAMDFGFAVVMALAASGYAAAYAVLRSW